MGAARGFPKAKDLSVVHGGLANAAAQRDFFNQTHGGFYEDADGT